jgi:hypothetical protein
MSAGVVWIVWPRLRVSSGRFAGPEVVRRCDPVPLQKGHALVAQELLISAVDDGQPIITELAACEGAAYRLRDPAFLRRLPKSKLGVSQSPRAPTSEAATQARAPSTTIPTMAATGTAMNSVTGRET